MLSFTDLIASAKISGSQHYAGLGSHSHSELREKFSAKLFKFLRFYQHNSRKFEIFRVEISILPLTCFFIFAS